MSVKLQRRCWSTIDSSGGQDTSEQKLAISALTQGGSALSWSSKVYTRLIDTTLVAMIHSFQIALGKESWGKWAGVAQSDQLLESSTGANDPCLLFLILSEQPLKHFIPSLHISRFSYLENWTNSMAEFYFYQFYKRWEKRLSGVVQQMSVTDYIDVIWWRAVPHDLQFTEQAGKRGVRSLKPNRQCSSITCFLARSCFHISDRPPVFVFFPRFLR